MKYGLYIHWPFCLKKCPYCDFNSYAMELENKAKWEESYLRELTTFLNTKPTAIDTVFFGGGTPSLMPISTLELIIGTIKDRGYNPAEITIETNPKTLSAPLFKNFKEAGINRVSIGAQSFKEDVLKFLGRNHSVEETIATIESAQKYFDNWSIDLMYALKEQSLEDWDSEISKALSFAPNHISLYQLTIEEGTLFHKQNVQVAAENKSELMYNHTIERLEKANLPYYEVSNFAKTGFESMHNQIYWKGLPYYGIGAGAHGRILKDNQWFAMENIKNPQKWVDSTNPTSLSQISNGERLQEFVLMGLRLRSGIEEKVWSKLESSKIKTLIEHNLLKFENNNLCHTREGLLKLNGVIEYLL